jgi:hypothetical protein
VKLQHATVCAALGEGVKLQHVIQQQHLTVVRTVERGTLVIIIIIIIIIMLPIKP